jgi:hypothetical protein
MTVTFVTRSAGRIIRSAAFEHWWFDQATPPGPIAFWGDLDFAGIAILRYKENNRYHPCISRQNT